MAVASPRDSLPMPDAAAATVLSHQPLLERLTNLELRYCVIADDAVAELKVPIRDDPSLGCVD